MQKSPFHVMFNIIKINVRNTLIWINSLFQDHLISKNNCLYKLFLFCFFFFTYNACSIHIMTIFNSAPLIALSKSSLNVKAAVLEKNALFFILI